MHFDKAAYKVAKERIIGLIKKSLPDWENTEGFIADGVICANEYEQQPLRILCILAETYGYDSCKMTCIETQPAADIMGVGNSVVMTPRKLATLLWLLQRSIHSSSQVTWDEFYNLKLFRGNVENKDELQKTLSKVAWINVKKASQPRGTKMIPNEVYAHAVRNQAILREQIQVIAPHLIIVGGEVAFRALLEMKLLGSEVKAGQKWKIQTVNGGPHVLEVSHPSLWRGYEKLYRHFENIYAQLPNTNGKPSTNSSKTE